MARVVLERGSGHLVLSGERGEFAPAWRASDVERARGLPAGRYHLRTARLERELEGTHWCVSISGPPAPSLTLDAGRTRVLSVDGGIHFAAQARAEEGEIKLGFSIRSADRRGLSIYRDDRRVSVSYAVRAPSGEVLRTGTMSYG